ncbi:MAG: STAS domain-containing protein [Syntrophomonas sp.]
MTSDDENKRNMADRGSDINTEIETLLDRLYKEKKSLTAFLDMLPIGISVATDVSCKQIRHNVIAAEFLREEPWVSFSHSAENPPAVRVLHKGKELSPEEMPIQIAAWQGKPVRNLEMELVWEDGVRKTSLWNANPLFDEKGTVDGVVATSIDMTAQKEAIRERERTRELEELNEMLKAEMEERRRAEEIISRQAKEILEVSTPVIQIWEGIVCVPLIGKLDSERTMQLIEQLLPKIVETQSSVALLDVTGVPTIDPDTAQYLLDTIRAVQMLGAEVVLTGIRPEIARTIVQLNVDLSKVNTRASFSAGLLYALNRLNRQVIKQP